MNKLYKKIIVNILILLCVLFIIEIFSFFTIFSLIAKEFFFEKKYRDVQNWFSMKNLRYIEDFATRRPVSIPKKQSGKLPIVILGCSYAFGSTLNDNETFSSQLSEYTGRTVYNLGLPCMGTASALYLLENPSIKEQIPEAQYFIYLFIYDHLRRNYLNMPNNVYNYFGAHYFLDKNCDLHFKHLNKIQMFLHSFYTYRIIENAFCIYKMKKEDFSLFKALLKQIKSEINQKYPKSEFVMLVYDDYLENDEALGGGIFDDDKNLTQICNELGIKIIYTKQMKCGKSILERKYVSFDGWHPTKEAWTKIVPELSEQLGL